ncbi:unnamed protein product, partial [Allacma fusca]
MSLGLCLVLILILHLSCGELLRTNSIQTGLAVEESGNKKLYVNYTGDFILGALFPIHRRGSGSDICDKIQ